MSENLKGDFFDSHCSIEDHDSTV